MGWPENRETLILLICGLILSAAFGLAVLFERLTLGILLISLPVLLALLIRNYLTEALLMVMIILPPYVTTLFSMPGLSSRISLPMIISPFALLGIVIEHHASRRIVQKPQALFQREDVWFGGFLFLSLVTSLYAWSNGYAGRDLKNYSLGISLYVTSFIAYLMGFWVVIKRFNAKDTLNTAAFFITIFVVSSIPLVVRFFLNYFSSFGLQLPSYHVRIETWLVHSTYFLILFFTAFGFALSQKLRKKKLFFAICALLYLITIYFFSQRATFIGLLTGLAAFLFFKKKILVSLSIFIFVIFFFSSPGLQQTGSGIFQQGLRESRVSLYRDAYTLIKKHPWSGVGTGGYGFFSTSDIQKGTTFFSAHNIYLDLAVDSGILAPIFFLFFVSLKIRKLLATSSNKQLKVNSNLLLAVGAGWVGVGIASLFGDFILSEISNVGFNGIRSSIFNWIILGLASGLVAVKGSYHA